MSEVGIFHYMVQTQKYSINSSGFDSNLQEHQPATKTADFSGSHAFWESKPFPRKIMVAKQLLPQLPATPPHAQKRTINKQLDLKKGIPAPPPPRQKNKTTGVKKQLGAPNC